MLLVHPSSEFSIKIVKVEFIKLIYIVFDLKTLNSVEFANLLLGLSLTRVPCMFFNL